MNAKILDLTEFYKFVFHKKIVIQKNLPLQAFATIEILLEDALLYDCMIKIIMLHKININNINMYFANCNVLQ